jgi:hypothetical protein
LIYNYVRNIITECLISVIMFLILDDYFNPDLIYNSVRNIITECLIFVIMFLILNDSCWQMLSMMQMHIDFGYYRVLNLHHLCNMHIHLGCRYHILGDYIRIFYMKPISPNLFPLFFTCKLAWHCIFLYAAGRSCK